MREDDQCPNADAPKVGGGDIDKMPVFIVYGMSIASSHAGIRHQIERTAKAILPVCFLDDDNGYLYLRGGEGGTKGGEARGELVWFSGGFHEEALRILDDIEAPWRKRGATIAVPEGQTSTVRCWAYFPESELPKKPPTQDRERREAETEARAPKWST